jgi:CDP-paratose 2-epimerase
MLEAIGLCEEIAARPMRWTYTETNRIGDHIWWISGLAKFQAHYPEWRPLYDVPRICREIYEANARRWLEEAAR